MIVVFLLARIMSNIELICPLSVTGGILEKNHDSHVTLLVNIE